MKMCEAMGLMKEPSKGFRISFEWRKGVFARGDHFPDAHEPLIQTKEEARDSARKFAERMRGKIGNVRVVDQDSAPINDNEIPNREYGEEK